MSRVLQASQLVSQISILGWLLGFVAWAIWIAFSIMGIINVVSSKQSPLLLIGGFAEKFKI